MRSISVAAAALGSVASLVMSGCASSEPESNVLLFASLGVGYDLEAGAAPADANAEVSVLVEAVDVACKRACPALRSDDAVVALSAPGMDSEELVYDADSGLHLGTLSGYFSEITVSVNSPDDSIALTTVTPSIHAVTVEPDPPVVGGGAAVKWSPSDESDVIAAVVVENTEGFTYLTDPNAAFRDDGTESLPEETFPIAGTHRIRVQRSRETSNQQIGSISTVIINLDVEAEMPL